MTATLDWQLHAVVLTSAVLHVWVCPICYRMGKWTDSERRALANFKSHASNKHGSAYAERILLVDAAGWVND